MIGTSGLLHIDTGNESATGIDSHISTFGTRERASGGNSGTFMIENMMSAYHNPSDPRGAKANGYIDRRDRHAGGTGRFQVIGGYQSGRNNPDYANVVERPAMNTELINVQTRKDPLGIRKMLKRNRVSGKIANVVDGIKGIFKGRKLLRRTRL